MNPKTHTQLPLENLAENPQAKPKKRRRAKMVTWVDGPRELNSLLGEKRYFLTIIEINPNDDKNMMVRVRCDCGVEKIIKLASLRLDTKSCGCKKGLLITNLHTKYNRSPNEFSPSAFSRWQGMKNRCYWKNGPSYHRYGGRGIKVCERWLNSFYNFLEDMGEPPPNSYLDRINNDGDYEPSNCRWVSPKESANNRSPNRWVMLDGFWMTVTQHAERLGVSPTILFNRIKTKKLKSTWAESQVKIGRPKWKNLE